MDQNPYESPRIPPERKQGDWSMGLTFTELAVVILIIVSLVALLLPAVSSGVPSR